MIQRPKPVCKSAWLARHYAAPVIEPNGALGTWRVAVVLPVFAFAVMLVRVWRRIA
jgi:hypothetical protein